MKKETAQRFIGAFLIFGPLLIATFLCSVTAGVVVVALFGFVAIATAGASLMIKGQTNNGRLHENSNNNLIKGMQNETKPMVNSSVQGVDMGFKMPNSGIVIGLSEQECYILWDSLTDYELNHSIRGGLLPAEQAIYSRLRKELHKAAFGDPADLADGIDGRKQY